MNNIVIVGRFTKDPILKLSEKGTAIASFTLAENDRAKNHTNFFKCVAFGTPANLIEQYCHKGDLVSVVGSMKQDVWIKQTERGDKVQMNNFDVYADRIGFLSKRKEDDYEHRGNAKDRDGLVLSDRDLYAADDQTPIDMPEGFAEAEGDIPF